MPKKASRRRSTESASEEPNMGAITLTEEQFQSLLNRFQPPSGHLSPVNEYTRSGNLSKCTSRFSGLQEADVDAFLNAVEVYKDCVGVSDENALKGLSMLLTDLAATWWLGVKTTIATWEDAVQELRTAFGRKKPAYQVYRELFSKEQTSGESTDIFICRCRALLADIPDVLTEKIQLDMLYGLLNIRLRKRLLREQVSTFSDLLLQARAIECSFLEESSNKLTTFKPKAEMRCVYCKQPTHTKENCPRLKAKSEKPADGGNLAKPSISCYGCGAPGVIRTKCPKCSKTPSSPAPRADTAAIQLFTISKLSCTSQSHPQRPLLPITINKHEGAAFADSGAQISVAGRKLYDLLKSDNVPFEDATMEVAFADGIPHMEDVKVAEVIINLGGRSIPSSFIAIPKLQNNSTLLGIDFLERANIVLDTASRTWAFRDQPDQVFPYAKVNISAVTKDIPPSDAFRPEEASSLDSTRRRVLEELLEEYSTVFQPGGEATTFAEHRIDTGDHSPMAVSPYPLSSQKKILLKEELDQMLRDDVIEECESPWSAPVVLVPKSNGGVRLCADFRKLNSVTVADKYSLPRIEELLHSAKNTRFMSTLDLKSGFWQVPVRLQDRDKTAIVTPFGLFRFKRMPFGLKNAPATFQRLMDRFRAGLPSVTMFVYFDDLNIISDDFEKHLHDLKSVFERLVLFNLRLNRDKCHFVCHSVPYLGYVITPDGIRVNHDKVRAVLEMHAPRNPKQLRTFIQTCSWYRRFIDKFSEIARPLTNLLKKASLWTWDTAQVSAFEELKRLLTCPPILRQADDNLPFRLRTDASDYALGAVLLQGEGPDERPIEYLSRLLTSAERNYSTTEREALAIVWAVQKLRGYIECAPVEIVTDHQPLRWLMTLKSPTGRLARWALLLQEFDLKIHYAPGKSNVVADTLSRPNIQSESVDSENCPPICSVNVDFPRVSAEEYRAKQLEDPDVSKIIESFEKDATSDDPSRWTARGYIMANGVLYRYSPDSEEEEPQLVVPFQERKGILNLYHDAPSAGHLGSERTFLKIATHYYWPGMRHYVRDHVKSCVACQKYKVSNQKPAGLLQTPVYNRRFEVLSIDLFGPLPATPRGNRWIYIIEDTATGWVELFPLIEATAVKCATVLLEEVCLRYGTTRRLISDNGVQFVSEVMQQVCYLLKIEQTLTSTYHPCSNPVERKNRDLKPQLAIQVGTQHDTWDQKLPSIRFAMNSAVSHSTGYSPSYLTFAREMKVITDVAHDIRDIIANDNFIPQITPYLRDFSKILFEAQEKFEYEQDRQKRYADEHRRPAPAYQEGDLVLVSTHPISSAAKGVSAKFVPKRDGPYVILQSKGLGSYVISDPRDREVPLATTNATDLTPFVGTVDKTSTPLQPRRRRGRPRKALVLDPLPGSPVHPEGECDRRG